jgi:serine/threonine protein kinase/TolB-like protein/Tfp pilus assembly protein PilF
LLVDRNSELNPGQAIGHYEVLRMLGEGGMGEVYLAVDTTELGRTVAIKLLSPEVAANPKRMQRFVQEAKTVSALNHPNILTIYEFGQEGATRFIATEFVEGRTLREHMLTRLKLHEVLDIAMQIAAALDAAHEANVIHRDIKPENVMVRRRDHIVKVLDFGLAKAIGPNAAESAPTDPEAGTKLMLHTEPGVVMGTVAYMSPEQSAGSPQVDHRTDIWSLGAVIYELLAGRMPFEGKDLHRQIIAIQETNPAPLARFVDGIPERLEEIVGKTLAKNPNERYQTAKDLLIDLRNLKRKLDLDAEIDRKISPEMHAAGPTASDPSAPSTVSGAARAQATAAPSASSSTSSEASQASSAEYLIDGIRRHKLGVLLAGMILVIAIGGLGYYLHARNTEVAIESIAVLPFINQSGDPNAEYLSDGLTESIINSLTQLPNLRVIARSSVFRYKGRDTDPLVIGKELGVRAVLVGRIMQHGDGLTISTELVDVRDNKQVWGEQYDRKAADLMSLQRDIAGQIANNLRLKISGEEHNRMMKHYTEDPEAYQLYLKGRFYWNKRTEENYQKAIDYFRQAIEKDPNYALAYTGLADSYSFLSSQGIRSPHDVFPLAKQAATKAIEIDNSLSEAHTSLAYVKLYYDWDWAGAEQEYKNAIELNPNYATPHHGYAYLLISSGRTEAAFAEIRKAEEIDPLSLTINTDFGEFYYFARRNDEAIAQLKKAIDMDAGFVRAHFLLGRALVQKGRCDEAIAEFQKARRLEENAVEWIGALTQGYASCGRKAEAEKTMAELVELSKQHYVSPHWFAAVEAELGNKDEAFKWLDQAFERRFGPLIYIKVNPIWDPLRSDPRFAEYVRRVGLPQ